MSRKVFPIVLIAFALIVQNTCPYGWAARTVFLSPSSSHCPHCPLKEFPRPSNPDSRDNIMKVFSNANHAFVLHIGSQDTEFHILSLTGGAPLFSSNPYGDVCLEPLLRPPASSLS